MQSLAHNLRSYNFRMLYVLFQKHIIAILSLIRLFKLNNQHYCCCHHKSSWQHYQGKAHLKNCIRRNPDFVFPNCNWSVLLSKKERERETFRKQNKMSPKEHPIYGILEFAIRLFGFPLIFIMKMTFTSSSWNICL